MQKYSYSVFPKFAVFYFLGEEVVRLTLSFSFYSFAVFVYFKYSCGMWNTSQNNLLKVLTYPKFVTETINIHEQLITVAPATLVVMPTEMAAW